MKKVITLVLFFLLVGLSYYTYLIITNKIPNSKNGINPERVKKADSYVNCSDIRKVIEEGEKYYVACHGGVVIADSKTGRVLDQITMAEGLSDYITTDLVKKGDVLYIGTQDGITIWNLATGKGRKLSVAQGLPSGANIILEEDGKYIWIGTFDGLARLDTEANNLEIFRKEFAINENEKININSIAVTDDYVYFSVAASAYSSGSVTRYNKNTSEWNKYTAAEFGDNTQYARIDAMGMCNVNDGVFFTEDKSLWKISNLSETVPSKVFTAGFNDYIQFDILCSGNNVLFKTDKNTFVYEAEKVRSANKTTDSALMTQYDKRKEQSDYTVIFGDLFYGSFGKMLGVIDNNIYLSASKGFWVYNTTANKLTQIAIPTELGLDSMSDFVFWPIEKSNKFVIGEQTCGMGCAAPVFIVCEYPSNNCSKLAMPTEAVKLIGPEGTVGGGEFGYFGLITDYIKGKDKLVFKVNILNKTNWVVLDGKSLKWSVEENFKAEENSADTGGEFCVNDSSFLFKLGALTADKIYCVGKERSVNVGDYQYKFDQKSGALRVGKNGAQEILNAPMSKAKYVPFNDQSWDNPQLNKLKALDKKVYYATNRGLWVFDTTAGTWNLLSVDDGLLSNDVLDFWITGNKMTVLTSAGVSLVK